VPKAELGDDEANYLLELFRHVCGLFVSPSAALPDFHLDHEVLKLLVLAPELLNFVEFLLPHASLRLDLLLLELDDVALEAVRGLPQLGVVDLELVVVLLHEADLLVLESEF
jgi:hypothetical protein